MFVSVRRVIVDKDNCKGYIKVSLKDEKLGSSHPNKKQVDDYC